MAPRRRVGLSSYDPAVGVRSMLGCSGSPAQATEVPRCPGLSVDRGVEREAYGSLLVLRLADARTFEKRTRPALIALRFSA